VCESGYLCPAFFNIPLFTPNGGNGNAQQNTRGHVVLCTRLSFSKNPSYSPYHLLPENWADGYFPIFLHPVEDCQIPAENGEKRVGIERREDIE
jgi:hypothetical protein